MNENASIYEDKREHPYQNVPAPVGSPGEKIAELARHDRQLHPVNRRDRLEPAPEFSPENISSEASAVHRLPYEPRHYDQPRSIAPSPDTTLSLKAGKTAGRILCRIANAVGERPGIALAIAAGAGFAVGRIVR